MLINSDDNLTAAARTNLVDFLPNLKKTQLLSKAAVDLLTKQMCPGSSRECRRSLLLSKKVTNFSVAMSFIPCRKQLLGTTLTEELIQ